MGQVPVRFLTTNLVPLVGLMRLISRLSDTSCLPPTAAFIRVLLDTRVDNATD